MNRGALTALNCSVSFLKSKVVRILDPPEKETEEKRCFDCGYNTIQLAASDYLTSGGHKQNKHEDERAGTCDDCVLYV
jgi:hypothetical protein